MHPFHHLIPGVLGPWGLIATVAVGGALVAARGPRPLAIKLIGGYLTVSEGIRNLSASVVEQAQDLYEEGRAQFRSSAAGNPTGARE
jgi:hypothetical protein